MMKKAMSLILAGVMVLGLTACGAKKAGGSQRNTGKWDRNDTGGRPCR